MFRRKDRTKPPDSRVRREARITTGFMIAGMGLGYVAAQVLAHVLIADGDLDSTEASALIAFSMVAPAAALYGGLLVAEALLARRRSR